jgi:membrane protease YdiL (CAAX protease family)
MIFILWVKFVEKRSIKSIGFQTNKRLKSYFTGILIGFTSITIITIILIFIGQVKLEVNKLTFMSLLTIIGILSLGWIIQSASEEISIRGWLIPTLSTSSSPFVAIAITAIIFGILHLFSSGVTVLSFLNLTLSGIFFAGYAIYSENIVGVCGLHFAWNFTLANIYGFSVSGFISNGETIFQATQVGSTFYTGGSFGPEGGFITTILLIIGISILGLKIIKKYCIK